MAPPSLNYPPRSSIFSHAFEFFLRSLVGCLIRLWYVVFSRALRLVAQFDKQGKVIRPNRVQDFYTT